MYWASDGDWDLGFLLPIVLIQGVAKEGLKMRVKIKIVAEIVTLLF